MEKGYKKLLVWQEADKLAFEIYLSTKTLPAEEKFGITSQIRRSALSVATNLVEGYGRQNKKELKYFTNVALGSLAETDYFLDFAFRLGYLSPSAHKKLQNKRGLVGKLLWGFYKSL